MHSVSGGCHCRNILVEMQLTQVPDRYSPRACDCDFCVKHGAAYVSDPKGFARFRISDENTAGKYTQGDALAEFLLCRNCGVLIGALHRADSRLYATLNAKLFVPAGIFGAQSMVSPKKLPATDKQKRWQELWFANVDVPSWLLPGAGVRPASQVVSTVPS